MTQDYYVYVMGSTPNAHLYVGITTNLEKRVMDHKNNMISGFPDDYNLSALLYYERVKTAEQAIARESMLKKFSNREWLVSMIKAKNPLWQDLYNDLVSVI